MNKADLIEKIKIEHRQLERYLFYFEKNRDGVFVASDRPKFGIEEMLQPGVVGDWSLKDLLSHLIDWETRMVDWYQTGLAGGVADAPIPEMRWHDLDTGEQEIPTRFRACSIQQVLYAFHQSYQRILSTVEAVSEEALFTPGAFPWTGDATVADYVSMATVDHYEWAKKHIRRWRKTHAGDYLNKKIILSRIETERQRLEKNLAGLSEEQMTTAGVIGKWSVKDIMAHLVDWEQRFLAWYEAGLRGEIPDIPAPGIGWGELDVLNQQIYEKHRSRGLEDVQRDFQVSYRQVLTRVQALTEEEMFTVGRYAWLGQGNLVAYILANTANHYRWANVHIRNWVKTQGE